LKESLQDGKQSKKTCPTGSVRHEDIKLNYDRIAGDHNQRYPSTQSWGVKRFADLASQFKKGLVLEVGSGTGYWLNLLHRVTPNLFGLDYSLGMLQQSMGQPALLKLARGSAVQLPYRDNT
jgi:ubiquinone/menaquinone biosynthesis C-methylase UbiE